MQHGKLAREFKIDKKTAIQVRKPVWLLFFHLVETRGIEPLTS